MRMSHNPSSKGKIRKSVNKIKVYGGQIKTQTTCMFVIGPPDGLASMTYRVMGARP